MNGPQERITKMCRNDRSIVVFWLILMWVIILSVYLVITRLAPQLAGGGSVRVIALVAGVLVAAFNTIALIAVAGHLKNKQQKLYTEDLHYQEIMQGTGQKWSFMKVFDVLFILLLCYVTLLIPIIMQGKVLVGGSGAGGINYQVDLLSVGICVLAFGGYGYFLLKHSEKELKVLINNVYGRREEG